MPHIVPSPNSGEGPLDYSAFPTLLQSKFDEMAKGSTLRPVILTSGETWTRHRQKSLLSPPSDNSLGKTEQRTEKQRAFGLLE